MRKPLIVAMLIGVIAMIFPARASAGYITLSFGRTQLSFASGTKACTIPPQAVSLFTVADDLKLRGLTAMGNVTNEQVHATRYCTGGSYYPTWDDLTTLATVYGWSFNPRGMHAASLQAVTDPAVLNAEVCGSRDNLEAHGLPGAWGMFAWPQNRFTNDLEATYVPPCFAFGRRYAAATKVNPLPITGPYWWAYVISVNGGWCADTTLICKSGTGANYAYMQPSVLAATLNRAATQNVWVPIQFYRLVTGTFGKRGDAFAWDCSSADARAHWSSRSEIYCYADYQAILNAVNWSAVTVTDAAGVAAAQGLGPAKPVHQ